MANVLIEENTMIAIANAIRGKTGKTDLILPKDMAGEIESIVVGGGTGGNVTETGEILDSWETIAANVENGTATSVYDVGTFKMLDITNSDGSTESIPMEIVAHNHDDKADGTGKATLTFLAKNLLNKSMGIDSDSSSRWGWTATDARKWLNGEFLTTLPSDLQTAITMVSKLSDNGYTSTLTSSIITTQDKVWIPSYSEVISTQTTIIGEQGELYPCFSDDNSRIRKLVGGSADDWWLRTAYEKNNKNYYYVNGQGYVSNIVLSNPYVYFIIGFCI